MQMLSSPSEHHVPEALRSPLDALAEELGAVAGQIEREASLKIAAAIAELQRGEAERELRFSKLERLIENRLASVKDGIDGKDGRDGSEGTAGINGLNGPTGERGEPGLQGETGTAGPQGEPGIAGERGEQGLVGEPGPKGDVGSAGERGEKGEKGDQGEIGVQGERGRQGDPGADGPAGARGEHGERGPQGERGEAGPTGSLPEIKEWTDKVHYQGDVRTHAGALFQASCDTAKEPPHRDWTCVAAAGRDGADGKSFEIRDTFDPKTSYSRLDVVSMNGASFAAKRDNPGQCPGDGWKLIAKQGGSGKPGDRGVQGPRGERGPRVEAMSVSEDGVLTLRNEDGSVVTCDLYPLLAKIA